MAYSIELICDNKIVELRFTGTNTIKEFEKGKQAALRKCKANGASRVFANLQEIEFAGSMTTIELFEIAETWEIQNLEPGFRMAVLVSADRSNDVAEAEFGSAVARNKGIPLRPFTNSDDAVDWLLS